MKKFIQIVRTVPGWSSKTFGSENVNITYLDIICVCFLKTNKTKHWNLYWLCKKCQFHQNDILPWETGLCFFSLLLLTACTELFRKGDCILGTITLCAGAFAHAKPSLLVSVVGACTGTSISGKCSPCSGGFCLWLAQVESRSLWPAQEINSSILSHMDQPSPEGDAAFYTCAARSSAGTSQALLLPCSKAI